MTRIIVDEDLRSKLHNLAEPLELCDSSGRVLGRVVPTFDLSEYEPCLSPSFETTSVMRKTPCSRSSLSRELLRKAKLASNGFAGLPATRSNTYRFSSICWTTRAEMDGVRSSRLITWGRSASRASLFVPKHSDELMLQDKDESVRKAATEELAKIKKLKR